MCVFTALGSGDKMTTPLSLVFPVSTCASGSVSLDELVFEQIFLQEEIVDLVLCFSIPVPVLQLDLHHSLPCLDS